MLWRCRERVFDVGERTLVMGIVNVTPDSFSDAGRSFDPVSALDAVERMVRDGADLIDLGAESTRPGAQPVAADEQIRRLRPVLEALHGSTAAISVDTANGVVAQWALEAGACAINDTSALADPTLARAVAETGAGVVLMHMRGRPETMQQHPRYDDVAREVAEWLAARLELARRAGLAAECTVVDPGIGFGKTARHNLELLARLEELEPLGRPVLIGVSRKSFLAGPEDLAPAERLEASLAAAAVAVFLGARIVRVHDVAATRRAIRVADSLRAARRSKERAQSA